MSERKVLNKYYPPDFDPNKIPRLKRPKNRQFSIRIMAPFNMRCSNCGEYIYKGKKFNSRQERVEDEDYLGLMIFRFYIKCPRCVAEISFKTDPQNCDYALEAGATRNFEALRTAERLAEQELKEKEEEEKNNPMKVLENRTKASQQEMEMLETLEELRELNSRHAKVDHEEVLRRHKAYEEQLRQLQDEEDEQFIRSIFGKSISGETVKRVHDNDDDDDDAVKAEGGSFSPVSLRAKIPCIRKPTDILTEGSQLTTEDSEISSSTHDNKPTPAKISKDASSWQKSIGSLSKKNSLLGIVKKKKSVKSSSASVDRSPAVVSDEQTRTENSETTASTTTTATTTTTTVSATTLSHNIKDSVNNSATDGKDGSSKPTALGMLGAYSDTSSDDSN